jgi:membrane fusion protein (multidrug efflux system)
MDAKVDVHNTEGRVLAGATQRPARAQTSVFDRGNDRADAEVKRIIAANMGRSVSGASEARPLAVARSTAPTPAQSTASVAAR